MNKLALLVIEDDKDLQTSYSKQIKLFNQDQKEVLIEASFVESEKKARDFLSNRYVDAAIIDLKLGKRDTEYTGNKIVDLIKNNLRFPAFILTANPEKIEEEEKNQNDLFRIKIKGTEEANFTVILNELKQVHLTGITKILGKSGQIEKFLNEIFWKHLSNSINIWADDRERTPKQKEQSLLRYTLLHVQEYLELTDDSNFDNYHPAEVYITPPVKPNLFTGDIIQKNDSGQNYIVLTPACDLAQGKAKDILTCLIEENTSGIISEKKNLITKDKTPPESKKEAEEILKKLIHNSYSNKYHFLPKYNSIEGGLINFQKVQSVRYKQIIPNYTRIASLNNQFAKDVIARFSYYYSRQGSPDFNTEEIYNNLFQK